MPLSVFHISRHRRPSSLMTDSTDFMTGPFLLSISVISDHVHVRYMLSPVRLSSVCRLSVTLVRHAQAVEIFRNISTALGTLAVH